MKKKPFNRRSLLLGGLASLGALAWVKPTLARLGNQASEHLARVAALRHKAVDRLLARPSPQQVANGDEEGIPERRACFTKGLPHDARGRVDEKAYRRLLTALESGREADFEKIPLGGPARLANPQAAFTTDLLGPDPSQLALDPAPKLASAEQANELIELYWMALLRDIPFLDWPGHPLAEKAASELSWVGTSGHGMASLFRLPLPEAEKGPYLSQFLLLPIPWRPLRVEQQIRAAQPGLDFLMDRATWQAIQNGGLSRAAVFDAEPRFARNGRDLAEVVHRDFTYQTYLGAALTAIRMGAAADGGNPYKHSRTQSAFVTFGEPYLLYLLAVVTQVALQVCWYQKWRVHRRVRPEEVAGLVEMGKDASDSLSFLDKRLYDSGALEEIQLRHHSAFLPQAYPEGCPLHPSYPSGHAVIAGACTTVLKALLDQKFEIPEPVEATAEGCSLLRYKGTALSLGNELDKLAANIAMGRNFAGIHWRSDNWQGLLLGEKVALAVLEEQSLNHGERFGGYELRSFLGQKVAIAGR